MKKLIEILRQNGERFVDRLRDQEVKDGLKCFVGVLKIAIEKRSFLEWSDSRFKSVVSVARALVGACYNLRKDSGYFLVANVFDYSVELCLCYLQSFSLRWPTQENQELVASLLEMVVLDSKAKELAYMSVRLLQGLEDDLSDICPDIQSLDFSKVGNFQFVDHLSMEGGNAIEKAIAFLANEDLNLSGERAALEESTHLKDDSNMTALAQHHAVHHHGCISRLLVICRSLITDIQHVEQSSDDRSQQAASLIACLLKLLVSLAKVTTFFATNNHLLLQICELADTLPCLFKLELKSIMCEALDAEGVSDCAYSSILESFFQFVHDFVLNAIISENLRVFILASLLDILDGNQLSFNKQTMAQKHPVVFKPEIIIRVLRFVREHRVQNHKLHFAKSVKQDDMKSVLACNLRGKPFDLQILRSLDDQLQIILPKDIHWLESLLMIANFHHSQALKMQIAREKSSGMIGRDGPVVNEVESAIAHEDDALFGDLFKEPSKQTSIDLQEKSHSSGDDSSDVINLPLQGALEVLNFLKECVFSQDWNTSIRNEAIQQLSPQHISILLQMLHSEQSHSEPKTVCQEFECFYNASFSLLYDVVTKNVLCNDLEEDLVNQVMKLVEGKHIYTENSLVLVAQILIMRAAKRSDSDGDLLRLKLFKDYVNFVMEKIDATNSGSLNVEELHSCMQSLFHLELLLLAFNSSKREEKYVMVNYCFSSLKKISCIQRELDESHFSCWVLLVSRLLLIFHHMVRYSTIFPSWLMLRLRNMLRGSRQKGSSSQPLGSGYLESCINQTLQNLVKEGISEEYRMDDLFRQLIDVYQTYCHVSVDPKFLVESGLDNSELSSVICLILDAWKLRNASKFEDLILERYCFFLGWTTLLDIGFGDGTYMLLEGNMLMEDMFNAQSFHCFTTILRSVCLKVEETSELSIMMVDLLSELEKYYKANNKSELSWLKFRHDSWLSLVTSLLYIGLRRVSIRHSSSRNEDDILKEGFPSEASFLMLSEQTSHTILGDNKTNILLNVLTSLLTMQVQSAHNALPLLEADDSSEVSLSKSLLLRCRMEKAKQDELLAKIGADTKFIDSMLESLPKLIAPLGTQHVTNLNKMFMRSMLHGFPCNTNSGSSYILSSVVSVEGILCTIEQFLKAKDVLGTVEVAEQQILNLVDAVMSIKYDGLFESIHDKCTAVLCHLIPSEEARSIFKELHFLKHTERLLKEMSTAYRISPIVLEHFVISIVDAVECLRMDPVKASMIKYYLGSRGDSLALSEQKQLFSLIQDNNNNLLSLLDALDSCHDELINIKVLEMFVNLLSIESSYNEWRQGLQRKFLHMDTSYLAAWLEKKLLGSQSEGGSLATIPPAVRDITFNFLNSLLIPLADSNFGELRDHILNALLVNLEKAFLAFDVLTAKAYFSFVIQLANGENSTRQLIRSTISIMKTLSADENHLEGLKFILDFLISMFGGCGPKKQNTIEKTEKSMSSIFSGLSSTKIKSNGRKSTDVLVNPVNPGVSATAIECDATSADDDEDDGTSDGEMMSVDKEDEDDSNSEKSLASKVCTFTSSGSNYMEQHWYFCYTCDLTVSKGCCSICARVCHRGHKVVYSRLSRFFCDCGAGGVRGVTCLCLKPRKYVSSENSSSRSASNIDPFLPLQDDGNNLQPSDSDSEIEEDNCVDIEKFLKLSMSKEEEEGLLKLLMQLDVESQVFSLCNQFLPSLRLVNHSMLSSDEKVVLGDEKVLSYNSDILQLKKSYKSGSFDMKIKTEYSNARELKSHLSSGSIVKSLLAINGRGKLAAGEGDKVTIFDAGQLGAQASIATVTADKTNAKPLSRNAVRFELVHMVFNSANENYLAVAGYEECQVLTINSRGEIADRLPIELALQGAYIRKISWLPGSQVHLMVVTNKFVKIYDLAQDNISPMHYYTLLEDSFVDVSVIPIRRGRHVLLALSKNGILYRHEIEATGYTGAQVLVENILVPSKEIQTKGLSLCFASTHRMLFLSYQDNLTLIGRLDSEAASIMKTSSVVEDSQGDLKAAGLHHWNELLPGSGLFICLSGLKTNTLLVVSIGAMSLSAQILKLSGNSTSLGVGIAAYKPVSKDNGQVFILHDDGSLQVFSCGVASGSGTELQTSVPSISLEQVKKLGPGILNSRMICGTNPEFPLDFFEKTTCITSDIKLGGDVVRNNDSDGVKHNLTSDDGFLEGPSTAGFKITVYNSNPEMVMVGCRVQVGNTSASHIPRELSIFQRAVKLEEGMRCWYDIPFTSAEALWADEEFTLTVGPTFNGSALPRIDSLEVYGRAKDDFGWKEKLDTVLDLESHALTGTSGVLGRKYKALQSASMREQVIADALKLLAVYYSLYWKNKALDTGEKDLDSSRNKCRPHLEMIFQSDRLQLLQYASRQVLQSLYPSKEEYYKIKDAMRLAGVMQTCPLLASKLGNGSATTAWVIKEFTAQVNAVCKIALHRQENLATFLETEGSSVVDGLMEDLWMILDLEQPDTQTINSIVVPSVELIFSYAECLALHGNKAVASVSKVAPAVAFLRKLIFAPYEAVQTSCSLAMSSRLLQVPFPKQTMLATDDAVENAKSVPVASDTGTVSVSSGRMADEDVNTASVQYCCDGCSTVPILRRRWHCNVCPDFDLCETCYEMMDSERLPHPHTRDHPMSALPIEVDSLGGDGSEVPFSIDEFGDENSLQPNNDINIQNTQSVNPILETTDTGDFSRHSNDRKVVTLSASKRAVNSLILSQLMEEIKGWMKTTSGCRAIPIMQLFYRLASAVSGPFLENLVPRSLDLEMFVNIMMSELDLNGQFNAKTRSTFGEVIILVFMFFTFMLRHWHQPGNEQLATKAGGSKEAASLASSVFSSEGKENNDLVSHLEQACTVLRKQQFVNYLMVILQQLVHVFKSTSRSGEVGPLTPAGAACGALLTAKREFPAGNFVPYFSDAYAKAHRADLFSDFHRLLLETTFRLVYNIIRPEKSDRPNEKTDVTARSVNKDIKLDGWQEVLCSYISNPHTTFIRKYARRLFLHLCGSKTQYYNVRDAWQVNREVKKLDKLVNKCGGLKAPFSYEKSVKLVKCLSAISEVATARPRNWQKYCLRHKDVLQFLLNGIFYFGEESVLQTLKLLTLAFYCGKDFGQSIQKLETVDSSKPTSLSSESKKKKRGDDGSESNSDKSYLDMEQSVDIFIADEGSMLRRFVDRFLLEWNSASIRVEAKSVLHGVWYHGKQGFRRLTFTILLQKVPMLPLYGQNIMECSEFLAWLLGKGVPGQSAISQEAGLIQTALTSDVIKCIFDTLQSQNELLANHPNCRIYNTLSSLVEFDGYYLESEPCVACSCPEVPYTRMKLEGLKSETKYTDNRIIVKCTGSHTIQSVTMTVQDARRSKCVKVLNLYYNNRPVADLSELKNNWSLWKRAKSCHLAFNQTELKVEFPIPITACNFMIELDSFYENLQASSLESLQCPRCSRFVTDKHGICSNCHENAYQCRQCRNINYENLDSFLCNECGFSKYGRFEFMFMAKPSFIFDSMENDEDMKKGLAAIEAESENAHRRYQQLLNFKKPLLKLVSSIGETEIDSQQKDKDSVQQMMVSLPGSSSLKINRKIALLGVLYGEKCKAAFDSVSKSVQTLQGLRRVLLTYLEKKNSNNSMPPSRFLVTGPPNRCYGCATTFVTQCLELLQVLSKYPHCKQQLVSAGILSELFENNIHQGPKSARVQARSVICAFSEGDTTAVTQLNDLIKKKVTYCLEHHRSMDTAASIREEMQLLSETCSISDEFWEARLRVAFQLLFLSVKVGARHPPIAEHIILPCLRIICQACTPPKAESANKDATPKKVGLSLDARVDENAKTTHSSPNNAVNGDKSQEKDADKDARNRDVQLLNYAEWEKGASYLDFVRRQYKVLQSTKTPVQKSRRESKRADFLSLKYALRWKRRASKVSVSNDFTALEQSSWVSELMLCACSQSIRSEMCGLINVLCSQSSARQSRFLNLLMSLLPATQVAGESSAEFFELLFKMVDTEDARLYLTVKGFLSTICELIKKEVTRIEAQERSFHIDISQGFILHKLIELLSKFLELPNIRSKFMHDGLMSQALEAFVVIRGLIVQKTKLISDCCRLLKELLDSLLDNDDNKRHFIRACIAGLQNNAHEKRGRTLFILEQLCNIICPTKPEAVYFLILSKAHTQEEFIRGSMTKNPYSSAEIGPLMRDAKNKICHQLDLLGLLEDDFGMELLVAGNIISLDLSISQVYEQVWRKAHNQATSTATGNGVISASGATSNRDCPPMTVTYRLQGLDGEATEPMIKELEEDREETQDPEVEFAIAGAMQECRGLNIILGMVQNLKDEELKSNQEELDLVLKLLMYCCKIRSNRQALLRVGALSLLLEIARRAFSVDAVEPAEGILLIVESLVMEANESDIGITESVLDTSDNSDAGGEQAAKVVSMFLDRLCNPSGIKMSNKQQRNNEMIARILPYLTYGEQAAMEVMVEYFIPYLIHWREFDESQMRNVENMKDDALGQKAAEQKLAIENFVKLSESIKNNSCGKQLKDVIIQKGIARVAVEHLKNVFIIVEKGGEFKYTPEWLHSLTLPSVPVILSLLRGLSRGHFAMQQCIDEGGILPLLHVLEGVSGESEIGVRAENLLDTLADKDSKGEGFLTDKVHQLRHATRDEMRRRALKKREELLQRLGMRWELASDGGERIVVSKPDIEGLEEVEEEQDGIACMVCREGYSLRPTDMLGAYSFSKRVNLGIGNSSSARGEMVYTTVSHFNIIHFQCHQEAKRADAQLKNPKKEWEGAALRNNETLCNNLFPLKGPSVPLPQYARTVDQFWDSLSALGRGDGSRLRLLTYDVVLMLARFATGASFSVDCKGGGKESNSRLLPFMIQMAQYLLDQGGANQRKAMAKTLTNYLAPPSQLESSGSKTSTPTSQRSGFTEETVQFMMVQSLLIQSLEEWQQSRRFFLQKGICHAYMQNKHGKSTLTSPASPSPSRVSTLDPIALEPKSEESKDVTPAEEFENLYAIVKPMLIYVGLVDQLQQFLKLVKPSLRKGKPDDDTNKSGKKSGEDSSMGSMSLEPWEIIMRERLQDIKGMLAFSKDLLSWLEDMQVSCDMQEAFDIMGALGDALSGGFSSCEDFVRHSIIPTSNK